MGGVLQVLLDRFPIEIAEVNGGSAQNAIPREAAALVLADSSRESDLESLVATAEAGYKADLGGFDSGLQITVEKAERPGKVLDANDAKQTVALLSEATGATWRYVRINQTDFVETAESLAELMNRS